ncbi:MAG: putative manganese-dependent inorganic diphosphatase [Clostridiales bacterium]|nr:putative manganese-dependent inorganic diphosphatase [Clostridiales bacterium]
MKKEVNIIGHKNPDTDSICSAISYAWLKNKIEENTAGQCRYIARRAGQISSETAFVLNAFHMEVPSYINDVRSQVQDANLDESHPVDSTLSLKNAWRILNERHLATLPVVDKSNHLEGLITLGDIAKSFMGVYGSTILSEAKTPYKNILETIDGELLVGNPDGVVTRGKVLIAAANPDLMENYIEEDDIVILGDRYESQLCAIEMNASCLIVCMGADVSFSIQKLAQDKGCAIMKTEYDTFITARLLNQSIPISHFMVRDHLITFRLDNFVEDIKNIMAGQRHRDFPVLDSEDRFIGMLSRHSLIDMNKKKLILVDHNEKSQAVDGINDAYLLEIIDHHKLGHVETLAPVNFRNQPVGCTSTIIYIMYKENNIDIPPEIAGLMCSAIISDTLLFRSPTCTPLDRQAATALAQIAGIDMESYARDMFNAGSNLKHKSAEDIFYQDFKKFTAGNTTFGVGQITAMNQDGLDEVKGRMMEYLELAKAHHEVDMIYFMLTNILSESTELLCYGDNAAQIASDAFGKLSNGPSLFLEGVVSRKKQLIPKLMGELQQQ